MKMLGELNLAGNGLQNGKFEHLDTYPSNPTVGTWAFIEKQLMVCVEMEGAPVWVPLTPKRNTHVHEQDPASTDWAISHSFDSENVMVQCFDEQNNVIVPTKIETIDEQNIKVTFPHDVKGSAIVMFGYTEGHDNEGKFSSVKGLPVGAIFSFVKESELPENCLPLMGQTVTRENFPELVTLLAGEAATEATLDDARGVFVRNLDAGKGKDVDRAEGSEQASEVKLHSHEGSVGARNLGTKGTSAGGGHSHTFYIANTYDGNSRHALVAAAMGQEGAYNRVERGSATFTTHGVGNHAHSVAIGSHDHTVSINNAGGAETRPQNIAYILVIKAR